MEIKQINMLPLLLREEKSLKEEEKKYIKEEYNKQGRERIEKFLRSEKSNVPFASYLFTTLDCDRKYWDEIHNQYLSRNTEILSFLDKLFKDYYDNGGKTLCVVENFGSVLSSGISLGCFASSDVDITADVSERNFLLKIFKANGFVIDKRGSHASDSKQLSTFHNKDVLGGKGYWINIMWQPISRAYLLVQKRYDKRLSYERLHNSEIYKNTHIRILDPTAMTYFCALHIACGHYYSASPGMSLLCDVDRIAKHRQVNWEKILKWSIDDESGIRIPLVFHLCNQCLKTNISLDGYDINSNHFKNLVKEIIDENCNLNHQLGKLHRLYVELASDNKPILWALICRLWK